MLQTMYRRWIYMILAIIASAFLFTRPVLSFQEDRGIIYIRSFAMDQKVFTVTLTDLKTNVETVTQTMSVAGLYYCNKAMLYGSILCFLCFFSYKWRIRLAMFTAFCSGAYYILMVYYALRMSSDYYATLTPNFMALLPGIVLQMMVMVRQNVIKTIVSEEDEGRGGWGS